MAEIDEGKRNKDWTVATIVSTIVIIFVVIYLLVKMFMTNPLKGSWTEEDENLTLVIQSSGAVLVTVSEVGDASEVELKMDYTLDKDAKLITFHVEENNVEKLSEESGGQFTKEMLRASVSPILGEFDYNVDDGKLVLMEREYGGQLIFEAAK